MFNKFANIAVISTFVLIVILPITWFGAKFYWQYRAKSYYEKAAKNFDKAYTYHYTHKGSLNQAIYGTNFSKGKDLLEYYKEKKAFRHKLEKGLVEREIIIYEGDTGYLDGVTIPNSVDLNSIPVKKPIYIRKEKDSVLEAFVFNTRCWGYYRAFLPKIVVYDSPPPDSLYEDFKDHVESLPKSDATGTDWSRYGFYCN